MNDEILHTQVVGRGSGLGNELFPWAKGFIASSELGIKLLHLPRWGLNPRAYYQYFGTSRFDWLGQLLLSGVLPRYTFTQKDYLATGEKDYAQAIRSYANKHKLNEKKS